MAREHGKAMGPQPPPALRVPAEEAASRGLQRGTRRGCGSWHASLHERIRAAGASPQASSVCAPRQRCRAKSLREDILETGRQRSRTLLGAS